jgi:hypothetical protein
VANDAAIAQGAARILAGAFGGGFGVGHGFFCGRAGSRTRGKLSR